MGCMEGHALSHETQHEPTINAAATHHAPAPIRGPHAQAAAREPLKGARRAMAEPATLPSETFYEREGFPMKKSVVVFAALIMALALFGCAGNSEKEDAPSKEDMARIQELMDGMTNVVWDNLTATAAVRVTDRGGGLSKTSSMDMSAKIDATGDVFRMSMEMSSPDEPDLNMTMDIVGNDCFAVIDGQTQRLEMEQSYIDELLESAGNTEKTRAIYETAKKLSLSEEDGRSVVHVVSDADQLTARQLIDGVDELTSCEADYTFDEEGRLVEMNAILEGSRTAAGITGQMTMQLTGKYFDYGTTVVPPLDVG